MIRATPGTRNSRATSSGSRSALGVADRATASGVDFAVNRKGPCTMRNDSRNAVLRRNTDVLNAKYNNS